jgi:hypothetical protein
VIFFHDTTRGRWNLEFMAAGSRAASRKTLVDSRVFHARARSIVHRACRISVKRRARDGGSFEQSRCGFTGDIIRANSPNQVNAVGREFSELPPERASATHPREFAADAGVRE